MKSDCRPGKGETYLTIGQDLFSINEYVTSQYNYSLHQHKLTSMSSFVPSVAMVYTDLKTLRGLVRPADYGSGVEYADGIIDSIFSDSSVGLQIGLWLNGTHGCEQIIAGDLDHQIQKLSNFLQNTNATTVFLRVGYEFDNPFFGYSDKPSSFIKAFQKVVQYLRKSLEPDALLRTQFVWHSWAAPRSANLTLQDFYPGTEFVDWIGISVFQQVYPWSSNWGNGFVDWGGSEDDLQEVLEFAKQEDKPTMIAESSPFGGINMVNENTITHNETDNWERWYARVIHLIEKHDIDMWSYINCDWESQPMWHNVGFGDSRLSSNETVMKKWQDIVINGNGLQKYLMSGSFGNCGVRIERERNMSVQSRTMYSVHLILLALCAVILRQLHSSKKEKRYENEDSVSERTSLRR